MHFVRLEQEQADRALGISIRGLRESQPEMSAGRTVTPAQRNVFIAIPVVLVIIGIFEPRNTFIGVIAALTALYTGMTVNRVVLFVKSRNTGNLEVVSDEEARSFPDAQLPVYTVLVPAYQEPEVVARLLHGLEGLEYPRDRLDVKLLLEADDEETIAAVRTIDVGDHLTAVIVPPAEPRTKPKALNYALQLARGDIVCIYDAEDAPDPLQLRRAAITLLRSPPEVACLQAKLSFANVDQNIITKWFTIEYLMWFSFFLPGLVSMGAPLPLGGTSNHFRRSVLEQIGAWDAHNVTEDADLGIRMARLGYRCGVLDSTTLEEANSDFINWVKQRSRWYKGYLQTALIHMRNPRLLRKQVGTKGTAQFVLFVGGTPMLAFLNPVFWLATVVWFTGHPHIIKELYPAPVFYVATASWIFGNFLIAYLTVLTCRLSRRPELGLAAALVPVYWVMMAIAATKAVYQLVAAPSYWEKTTHGLDRPGQEPVIDLRDRAGDPLSAPAPG